MKFPSSGEKGPGMRCIYSDRPGADPQAFIFFQGRNDILNSDAVLRTAFSVRPSLLLISLTGVFSITSLRRYSTSCADQPLPWLSGLLVIFYGFASFFS
jgi:hypothetical protein